MKTNLTRKLLSAVCTLALLLSLTPAARAAGSSEPVTGPADSRGTSHTYTSGVGNYASTVKTYLYANNQGGLTRVEGYNDYLRVENYDSSFCFLSGQTIRFDGLPKWGGFFAGASYNFVITGQDNLSESDSVEVIRVLKYSKDWQYLGKASIYGANTYKPFDAGSVRCAESGGVLYIHTCHEMYKISDGKNHQANMEIVIRESDMTVTEIDGNEKGFIGRVSHCFNQFIMVDSEGNLVLAAHGDATPRSMALYLLMGQGGNAYPNTGIREADLFKDWNDGDRLGYVKTPDFPGANGENYTGAMLGGVAETSNGYLLAYAQEASKTIRDLYQVKLAYIAKKDIQMRVAGTGGLIESSFQIKQISDMKVDLNNYDPYKTPDQGNPFLVSTGLSGGYILWQSSGGKVSYASYDANGQTGAVRTADGLLSDCQPIVYNGKVVWIGGDYGTPITFYTLDASGVTATRPNGSSTTTPGTSTTPNLPTTPVTSFKDVSPDHWAYKEIMACAEQSIVTGVGDGKFAPEDPVSYAEFIVMMTRFYFADQVSQVTDTAGKPWYYPYMKVARNYSLDFKTEIRNSGGWPEVTVANQPINRYDMASILRMVLMTFNAESDSNATVQSIIASIKDYDQIPELDDYQIYTVAVRDCYLWNVLTGMEDGCFHGEQTMTRAQACAVMVRTMNLLKDTTRSESRRADGFYTITVHCRDKQSGQILATRYLIYTYNQGEKYTVHPPVIEGYTTVQDPTKGITCTGDGTVTFDYIPSGSSGR